MGSAAIRASSRRLCSKNRTLVGVVAAALFASIGIASAATPPFSYGGLNWTVDRYNADNYTFPVSFGGRTDVMQIDLGPNGYADNRNGCCQSQFYSTQGIKGTTGLPAGEAFASVDLFIPSAWNIAATVTQDGTHQNNFYGNFTSVGLWGEIDGTSPAQTNGFPILRFRNGDTPGTFIWGFDDNTGNNISTTAIVNFGAFNNVRIEYRGDRYNYYFNGVLVATFMLSNGSGQTLIDDPTNALSFIFLNATTNNTTPNTFYWSHLKYGVIAVPGENQTLSANLIGAVEVENTGTMNISPGVAVSDTALVKSGGVLKGGTVANPFVINGQTTVNAGGKLGGDGNFLGGIVSAGNIAPGNSPGIITTASYNALPGATATMEVNLAAATPVNGTTHDFFHVTGNATGATTAVTVSQINAPGTGIATTGNGFELFRVDGTVSSTAFQLAAPAFNGGFQYFLNYVPTSGPDSFFLRSGVREEIWGHAALLSAGRTMTDACFRGLERTNDGQSVGQHGRAWVKYAGGNRNTGADTGIDMNQDFSCGSGGIDFAANEDVRLGVSGGYGNSSVDLTTPAGMAKLDGNQGVVEGYAAYARNSVFMNLSAGYSTTDWTFDGPVFAPKSATANGMIGSAQVGMRWPLGQLQVGLIGEVDYDGTSCGNSCLIAGVNEDASSWLGKATLRVDGSFSNGKIAPYVAVAYVDDFAGGNKVSMGTAVVNADTQSNLLDAQAGVTAYVGERVALFGNVGWTDGLNSDVTGFNGQGGVKLYW